MKFYIYTNKKIGNNTINFNLTRALQENSKILVSHKKIENSGYETELETNELSEQEISDIINEYIKTNQLKFRRHLSVTNYDPENGQNIFFHLDIET